MAKSPSINVDFKGVQEKLKGQKAGIAQQKQQPARGQCNHQPRQDKHQSRRIALLKLNVDGVVFAGGAPFKSE